MKPVSAVRTEKRKNIERFETLLSRHQKAAERYVHYCCASPADAEDILQEVYYTTHQHFHQLKNIASFKAWLLSIARHKCADFSDTHRHPTCPWKKKMPRPTDVLTCRTPSLHGKLCNS